MEQDQVLTGSEQQVLPIEELESDQAPDEQLPLPLPEPANTPFLLYRTGNLSLAFTGVQLARAQSGPKPAPRDWEDAITHTAAMFRTTAGRFVAAYARTSDWKAALDRHQAMVCDSSLDAVNWLLENTPLEVSAGIIAQLGLEAAEAVD